MTAITDTAIGAATKRAAATGKPVCLTDPGQLGLELRIWPGGSRMWTLACRDAAGRSRRFTIGQHPAIGLAAAREACRKLREDVRQGADPVAVNRLRRAAVQQAKAGENTLRALLDIYARQHGMTLKSWNENRRRIESVFADQLRRPLAELTLPDLQLTADRWPSRQSASAAVRYLRPILKWAAHAGRQYVARDLALITPPATPRRRQRVLSPEELAKLLPVLHASASAYAAAAQFMLLTVCRRDEACDARWRDIDFADKLWRLPDVKNTKGGTREHVVPLSRQALVLLRARLPEKPNSNALVFVSTDDGDGSTPLTNWHRATKIFMRDSKTEGWHRHDLRRTAATMMGQAGVDPHIIEAALGHISLHSQLAATYNTARYLPRVAEALQALADRLDVISEGGAKIQAIKFA
jgi:integrase